MKNKIDPAVARETIYVSGAALVLSVIMELVFLLIGQWSLSVLFGNILGAATAVLNFFLMGLSVQHAVGNEEKEAKSFMKLSQALRMLLIFVVVAVGALLPCFSIFAVIIPLFFVRIAVAFRPIFGKLLKLDD